MAQRLAEHDIQLAVIPTPANNEWQRDAGIQRLLQVCLSREARTNGFVFFSQRGLPPFQPADFHDHMHMNRSGRTKFTTRVIRHIKRFFPAEVVTG